MDDEAATDEQPALSDLDLAVLELERSWWKHPGRKEGTIPERFDMSPTRYYQLLNVAAEPLIVKRLCRLRDARQQQRSGARASV
jgi:hypothetical protein